MDRRLRSSTSSLYVTDEEEEERMEIEREGTSQRKRRLSVRNADESTELGEESEEQARTGEKRGRREAEGMTHAMKVLLSRVNESEKAKRRRNEKQKKVREEKGKRGDREVIEKVQQATRAIMEAVERKNGGKISFTRGDQSAVRKAVWQGQNEMLELMKRMMEAEEKARRAEEEARKCREAMEELRKAGKEGREEQRSERRASERNRAAQRREVVEEDSEEDGNWQERRVRRRQRTYAQVSAGVNGERIEGRVVVPGKEGWKTPPPKTRPTERALIVTSKEEGDARKLADSLAKSVTVEKLRGAPQVVRKIRDGKMVIVPKNGEQREKMVGALKRVKGVEVE